MIAEHPDDGFEALMGKVERERGFAWASYKQKCLRRRVAVRMRARGLDSYPEYATLLDRDRHEFDKLVDALTINVTRFFRNSPVWDLMASDVVPDLWRSQLPEIRVWSAGCASGEEAYSLAILFHREAAVSGMLAQIDRVRILGTDLDASALRNAEIPAYADADLTEVPASLRERYFTERPPFYPATGVRQMVRFARHDLLVGDYPPSEQHLIMCRNVLIYFDRATQERVITQFHQSLATGGYLILGKVETLLGTTRGWFAPVGQRERIFRKVS